MTSPKNMAHTLFASEYDSAWLQWLGNLYFQPTPLHKHSNSINKMNVCILFISELFFHKLCCSCQTTVSREQSDTEQTSLHIDGTQSLYQWVSVYTWHRYAHFLSSGECALPKWAVNMKWLRFQPISIHFSLKISQGLVT
jgi:hypothetical protein